MGWATLWATHTSFKKLIWSPWSCFVVAESMWTLLTPTNWRGRVGERLKQEKKDGSVTWNVKKQSILSKIDPNWKFLLRIYYFRKKIFGKKACTFSDFCETFGIFFVQNGQIRSHWRLAKQKSSEKIVLAWQQGDQMSLWKSRPKFM
jgi:hypothetical protein